MEVVATALGYYNGRRRVGDRFDVPEGTTGSWFEPAPAAPVAEADVAVVADANEPSAGDAAPAPAAPRPKRKPAADAQDDLTD